MAVRDLHNFPLVLLSKNYCTRRLWDECVQQATTTYQLVAEMNTISAILTAVQHLKGGTVLPMLALEYSQAQGLVGISLREPTPYRSVGLLWRRSGYRCAASQAFASIIKEFCSLELTA